MRLGGKRQTHETPGTEGGQSVGGVSIPDVREEAYYNCAQCEGRFANNHAGYDG